MENEWISPNTITGDAATGPRYFRRQHINDYFWQEVQKGNHILFTAPRRVGKTSIMKDLAENCPEGFYCIYQNIEGVKSRNEFYQRLFELIFQCAGKATKAWASIEKWWHKYGVEEVTKSGVKFRSGEIDYEKELRNLIPGLKEAKINTVIFLDEFAEVINKLNKKGQQDDAIAILHTLRELRSDDDFSHFTLVFAGSVGLEFVIKSIDRPKLINDLHPVETIALTPEEFGVFIQQLINGCTIQFLSDTINYLQQKLNHLLPYYIQLMLEEIDLIARERKEPDVSNVMIDEAFERVLRKNKNFDDWLIRLRDYHGEVFPFINQLLIHAAHKNQLTVQEIFNMASSPEYKRENDYMDFVEELVHDGYLVETQKHTYRFVSPFLQQYWLKKFPVYNG